MKKLLMVTHSAGFEHDYLPNARATVTELGQRSGRFQATAIDDCSLLTREGLSGFDALALATTGELPISDDDRQALLEFVGGGKGLIGIHNATDTFYQWEAYGELIGGYFNGHPWNQEAVFVVEDHDHPATRLLPPAFRFKEELYTHRNWSRDRTHVLISLDNDSVDLSKGNREDHDYAFCWCHPYGEGRVFYTGFGHYQEAWGQGWFREHLLGGILWAMRES